MSAMPETLPVDGLPQSKTQAIREGVRFFVSPKACPKRHVSPRYTRGGRCVLCTRESNAEKFGRGAVKMGERGRMSVARAAASRGGNPTFISERPCPRGHVQRFTASNNCVQCNLYTLARDAEARAWSRMKRKYGITRDDYESIAEAQSGNCPICTTALAETRQHVDHCHETGKVRGILCGRCNQAIGLLGKNPDSMRRAAEYVSR